MYILIRKLGNKKKEIAKKNTLICDLYRQEMDCMEKLEFGRK
jgi:hypothetical protein